MSSSSLSRHVHSRDHYQSEVLPSSRKLKSKEDGRETERERGNNQAQKVKKGGRKERRENGKGKGKLLPLFCFISTGCTISACLCNYLHLHFWTPDSKGRKESSKLIAKLKRHHQATGSSQSRLLASSCPCDHANSRWACRACQAHRQRLG